MSITESLNQPTQESISAQGEQERDEAQREVGQRLRKQMRPDKLKEEFEALEETGTVEEDKFVASLLDIKGGKEYYRIGNKTAGRLGLTKHEKLALMRKTETNDTRVFTGKIIQEYMMEKISLYYQNGDITFEPLGIEANTDYRITNRTAVRIHIANIGKRSTAKDNKADDAGEKTKDMTKDQGKWGDLVIPPFGTRTVSSETLKWYRFIEWERQDLIRVQPEAAASRGPGAWESFVTWLKLLPGLVLVSLVGFGIPLWIVYYFGDGARLFAAFRAVDPMSNVDASNMLGRVFQLGFICLASILPALFYYLFGRQHVEKLRQRFFRDILVLDPNLYTLAEAEAKYDTLLSSAYGSSSSSSPLAILLLMFSTVILVGGWTLTIAPYGSVSESVTNLDYFFAIKTTPLTLGFLGIYFFAINMVFRRYVRADLTPKTYANITVRMLITFILVWTVNVLPEFSSSSMVEESLKNGLLPLAFIIGVFPEDGFRLIRDSARNTIKWINANRKNNDAKNTDNKDNDEKYPLTDLEGLNKYDQARLLEEGIENIENLAHHNLVELLAFTRIPTERLIDMFDQSILYLHLGLFDEDEENISEMGSGWDLLQDLKSIGVRTATDLIKLLESPEMAEISKVLDEAKIARLKTIYTTFSDDGWLSFIKSWRGTFSAQLMKVSYVDDPNRFYEAGWVDVPQIANAREPKPEIDQDQNVQADNAPAG